MTQAADRICGVISVADELDRPMANWVLTEACLFAANRLEDSSLDLAAIAIENKSFNF